MIKLQVYQAWTEEEYDMALEYLYSMEPIMNLTGTFCEPEVTDIKTLGSMKTSDQFGVEMNVYVIVYSGQDYVKEKLRKYLKENNVYGFIS